LRPYPRKWRASRPIRTKLQAAKINFPQYGYHELTLAPHCYTFLPILHDQGDILNNGVNNGDSSSTARTWVFYALMSLIGVLLILVSLAIGIGLTLPQDYSFTRSIVISQPPDVVWRTIRDIPSERIWRQNLSAIERLPDRNGREAWRLRDNEGQTVVLEVVGSLPPQHLVFEYEGRHGIGTINWTIDIRPVANDSQVSLVQRSTFYPRTYRFLARFVYGTTFADDFLKSLARKFGDPEVVQ
jgi:Polyketide cyclase / dehydrase and lipid transport